LASTASDSFASSNVVGHVEEGLLIDFGDTPLVDPTTVPARPILYRPNKLDLLFDNLEIPGFSPYPVTLPNSPEALSPAISPGVRKPSMADPSTLISTQTSYPSLTPYTDFTATETSSSYRPRTRAERAAEPHTFIKPNWALASPIQRPIFTKEPGSVHLQVIAHTLPPSQPPGLNTIAAKLTSQNDRSPAPLEKPLAAPPHESPGVPLSQPSAPSIHPSRLQLLQSSATLSGVGIGPAEMKEKATTGNKNGVTGANTVPVARMRKWGAGATEDTRTDISAPGSVDEKGDMGYRVSWADRDPPLHSSAQFDGVLMSNETVAPARISVQASTLPTPTKHQPCSVTVESEDEDDTYGPAFSPSFQISHIINNSGKTINDNTQAISAPVPSAPSLVRPSALKKRAVVEHPREQTNPFIGPESAQESISIAKPRMPLLQRMGIGSRVGPSTLAARRQLFLEEGDRTHGHVYQYADEEAYEEEECWMSPQAGGGGWKKVVIAEPEERVARAPPMRTPAMRVVRTAEPGPLSQVQARRHRVIHRQEGEEGEEDEYGLTYERYQEEDLHIGAAGNRRVLVSPAGHNPPPRAFAPTQQDPPHHAPVSRARRVVIQEPLEAGDVDEVVERFRGLSVAGRVQTPGPRRHRVVKVR
jgi:hypothetical protein